MKANLKKRAMAYVIDILIVAVLASIISVFLPTNTKQIELEKEMARLSESYLANDIDTFEYLKSSSVLSHKFDKGLVLLYLIEAIILFLYYQILPYFYGGKTIGFKLMHIKIQDKKYDKLHFSTLFLRNLWANGFGYFILFMMGLYIFSDQIYLFGITFFAIIQILVVIASVFMIKYRRDKRSFADIVSHSNVILES